MDFEPNYSLDICDEFLDLINPEEVFGQKGVIAGASLEGAKYSRLIR